jgi:hypothetical protein
MSLPVPARVISAATLAILAAASLGVVLLPWDAPAADRQPTPEIRLEKLQWLPGGFGGRSGAARAQFLREEGGNAGSEAAVDAGLDWLARHQADDGSWDAAHIARDGKCNCDGPGHQDGTFGTSISLLAFLGAGHTHKDAGTYRKSLDRGLKWILSKQNNDGALSGNGFVQAMATIALCEAYGMTHQRQMKEPAQRAVNAIVHWQGRNGGFRYCPKQDGDLAVSGWHIEALASAKVAGLEVPGSTWNGVKRFLDAVGTADGSGYGYTTPQPTQRMTAVGLLCRLQTGWKVDNPGLVKGVKTLCQLPPSPEMKDIYYYYYATQVIRRRGGADWQSWNEKMRDLLIDSQDQGKNAAHTDQKGSWSSDRGALGNHLGRLGTTALSLLILEVYYRHLDQSQMSTIP